MQQNSCFDRVFIARAFSGDVRTDGLFQRAGVAAGRDGSASRDGGESVARKNVSCLCPAGRPPVLIDCCCCCFRILTWGWPLSPCSARWARQFKWSSSCILFHPSYNGVCTHSHPLLSVDVTELLTDAVLFTCLKDVAHYISGCCLLFSVSILLSSVVLKIHLSYLMVSSVVGFYSSPLFTSILPRVKDTNLTQVPDRLRGSDPTVRCNQK